MKFVIGIILICFAASSWSQQFENIAALNGISMNMSTPDRWGCGMSFYDFDDDGLDDLTFVLQNDSVRFYRNVGGSFVQIGSFLNSHGEMRQLLWVDYDNNGDLDLCASYFDEGVHMYKNDGNFNFTDVTTAIGLPLGAFMGYGISFFDYDLDGDLDLYAANYDNFAYTTVPNTNKLFQFENGTYQDVTDITGVANGSQASFMGVWFDYDNDGLTDLYVINDREAFHDALFHNNGNGTYTDEAISAGVLNPDHSPMTASVSDYDNDGDQDIFLTEIANGNVINGVVSRYNFYENQGDGTFNDIITTSTLDTNLFAWGALWIDVDNDSFEDLYIATGEISAFLPERTSLLYKNNSGSGFTEITDSINTSLVATSYCATKGDVDNDGFYDIAVHNDGSDPHILLNSGTSNNYIKVTPEGVINNKRAIGSEIRVYANGEVQLQTVFCGINYLGQNSQHKIFGVGSATVVDSIEIRFPDGITVKEYGLAVNQSYVIDDVNYQYLDLSTDTITVCPGTSELIGQSGYHTYLWNTGDTTDFIDVTSSGEYYFNAISGVNTFVYSDTFFINVEATPSVTETVSQPICNVEEFGSIELTPTSAWDSTFTVSWSDGSTGYFLDSLSEGWYTYSMTSQNGCIFQGGSIEIVGSYGIDVEFVTTPYSDTALGSVEFAFFGGVGPFEVYYEGVQVDVFIDTLTAGSYLFTVIDATGCENTVEVIVQDQSTAQLPVVSSNIALYYSDGALKTEGVFDKDQITLFNQTGQKIVEIVCSGKCTSLPLDLAVGVYFVVVRSSNTLHRDRIYVEN